MYFPLNSFYNHRYEEMKVGVLLTSANYSYPEIPENALCIEDTGAAGKMNVAQLTFSAYIFWKRLSI